MRYKGPGAGKGIVSKRAASFAIPLEPQCAGTMIYHAVSYADNGFDARFSPANFPLKEERWSALMKKLISSTR